MATIEDLRRIALSLPATTEETWYGMPGFKVRGKGFLRLTCVYFSTPSQTALAPESPVNATCAVAPTATAMTSTAITTLAQRLGWRNWK